LSMRLLPLPFITKFLVNRSLPHPPNRNTHNSPLHAWIFVTQRMWWLLLARIHLPCSRVRLSILTIDVQNFLDIGYRQLLP
jgi:hypothetical protein